MNGQENVSFRVLSFNNQERLAGITDQALCFREFLVGERTNRRTYSN